LAQCFSDFFFLSHLHATSVGFHGAGRVLDFCRKKVSERSEFFFQKNPKPSTQARPQTPAAQKKESPLPRAKDPRGGQIPGVNQAYQDL